MVIDYEGKSYEFDLDDVTIRQALKLEKHIGGTLAEFEKSLAAGDLAACQALGWLILYDGDIDVPIGDVDFKLGRLLTAFEAAAKAEAEAAAAKEAEAGPTDAALNGRIRDPESSHSG